MYVEKKKRARNLICCLFRLSVACVRRYEERNYEKLEEDVQKIANGEE